LERNSLLRARLCALLRLDAEECIRLLVAFAVAGFTVLADWLGSSQRWFPYSAAKYSLADYWQRIQPQAEHAVAAAGLLPAPSAAVQTYSGLTGVCWVDAQRHAGVGRDGASRGWSRALRG
jgi:hypothetical protein